MPKMTDLRIKFGVLTVSDSCYNKIKNDSSGPALVKLITKLYPNSTTFTLTVPDEKSMITETLKLWSEVSFTNNQLPGKSGNESNNSPCDVILTTGGTGFSPRDVTPEATKEVIQREANGIAYSMISKSLAVSDMAMLSRGVCGIRHNTLIINLPGSVKGATECFNFVSTVIPHAVELLRDDADSVAVTHEKVQKNIATVDIGPSKVQINNAASRPRSSPYPLLEVDEALKVVLQSCSQSTDSTECISVEISRNRILAEDIIANEPFPAFPASIKDGYAVRFEDGAGQRIVKDTAAAGDMPNKTSLGPGEAIRISTGAAIPNGANAVVQVENTTLLKVSEDGSTELIINVDVAPTKDLDIRQIGSDIPKDSLVLCKGTRIDAPSIGVLAALGKRKVAVHRKPEIGVLSTGNELVSLHDDLKPGKIRDSNKVMLLNLLEEHGFAANDCGIAKDNPDAVKISIAQALEKNDVLVSTGGVSMGEFDVIKQVLIEDFNAKIHFGRVNMKPGKPTTFATLSFNHKEKIVFGLPGNPVSACVCCLLFVLPAVKSIERNGNFSHSRIKAFVKGKHVKNNDIRPEFVRVKLSSNDQGKVFAESTGNQISSRLNSVIGASGLLYLPPKSETKDNEEYSVYIISHF